MGLRMANPSSPPPPDDTPPPGAAAPLSAPGPVTTMVTLLCRRTVSASPDALRPLHIHTPAMTATIASPPTDAPTAMATTGVEEAGESDGGGAGAVTTDAAGTSATTEEEKMARTSGASAVELASALTSRTASDGRTDCTVSRNISGVITDGTVSSNDTVTFSGPAAKAAGADRATVRVRTMAALPDRPGTSIAREPRMAASRESNSAVSSGRPVNHTSSHTLPPPGVRAAADALAEGVGDGVNVVDGEPGVVPVPEGGAADADGVTAAERLADVVTDGATGDGEAAVDVEADADPASDAAVEAVPVGAAGVREGDAAPDADPEGASEPAGDGVCDGVPATCAERDADDDAEGDPAADAEGDPDALGEGDADADADAEGDTDEDREADGVPVMEGDTDAVGDTDGAMLEDGVAAGTGDGVGVGTLLPRLPRDVVHVTVATPRAHSTTAVPATAGCTSVVQAPDGVVAENVVGMPGRPVMVQFM
jgi:hypothetical protein